MKRRATGVVLILLMSLLSGCLQNIKSRDCPAFDNPLAKQWQPVESGSSVVFTRADGESAIYLLQSITSSEPYVASIDVNSSGLDGPECEMTSTQVFSADDGSHELILEFIERDNDDANPAPDTLVVWINTTLPALAPDEPGRLLSSTKGADLTVLRTEIVYDELEPMFFASRTLENGKSYSDVIVFPSTSIPPESDFDQYSLSEVLLSLDVGLIQISRNNGNVYTIVPE